MKSCRWILALLMLLLMVGCYGGYPIQQTGMLTSCPPGGEVYLLEERADDGPRIGNTPTQISLTSDRPFNWKLKAVFPNYQPLIWWVHGRQNIDHYFEFYRSISGMTALSQQVSTYVTEDKNYVIGTKMKTPVGGEMIRVRKYHTKEAEFAVTNKSIEFGDTVGLAYAVAGRPYKVIGTVNLDGEQLYLVQLDSKRTNIQPPAAVAKKDGTILNYVAFAPYVDLYASGCPVPLPSGAVFEMKPVKDFSAFGGEGNYQILYSGATGEQIRLSYREFTSDDMARVAYYQELTYNKGTKKIRFRNIQIEVQEATNEYISFVVVAD